MQMDLYKVNFPALSAEDEERLIPMARDGDLYAIERIVLSCSPLIKALAARYQGIVEIEDLFAEGVAEILRDIPKFDATRGRFSSYAGYSVRRAIHRVTRSKFRMEQLEDMPIDPGHDLEYQEIRELLDHPLFPERERDILKARFGIGVPEETVEQLAARLNRTPERVRQLYQRALGRLRRKLSII